MTEAQPPEAEAFAAKVRLELKQQERSWPWLSRQTNIHVNTLRSQLLEKPERLKLQTARRVATALSLPMWDDAATNTTAASERAA